MALTTAYVCYTYTDMDVHIRWALMFLASHVAISRVNIISFLGCCWYMFLLPSWYSQLVDSVWQIKLVCVWMPMHIIIDLIRLCVQEMPQDSWSHSHRFRKRVLLKSIDYGVSNDTPYFRVNYRPVLQTTRSVHPMRLRSHGKL